MTKKLKNSVTKCRSLRCFRYVEKLHKLSQNFDVNFVLVYVCLDHNKAKNISYLGNINVVLYVGEISVGNITVVLLYLDGISVESYQ